MYSRRFCRKRCNLIFSTKPFRYGHHIPASFSIIFRPFLIVCGGRPKTQELLELLFLFQQKHKLRKVYMVCLGFEPQAASHDLFKPIKVLYLSVAQLSHSKNCLLHWPPIIDVIKHFWRKSGKSRFPVGPKQQDQAILKAINSFGVQFCFKIALFKIFSAG